MIEISRRQYRANRRVHAEKSDKSTERQVDMGNEHWTWGLLALAIGAAVIVGGFFGILEALPKHADPSALYAGLTGATVGLVGAYFGVATGRGAAQSVKDAKDGEVRAMRGLADIARLVPPSGNVEQNAQDVKTTIDSLAQ